MHQDVGAVVTPIAIEGRAFHVALVIHISHDFSIAARGRFGKCVATRCAPDGRTRLESRIRIEEADEEIRNAGGRQSVCGDGRR